MPDIKALPSRRASVCGMKISKVFCTVGWGRWLHCHLSIPLVSNACFCLSVLFTAGQDCAASGPNLRLFERPHAMHLLFLMFKTSRSKRKGWIAFSQERHERGNQMHFFVLCWCVRKPTSDHKTQQGAWAGQAATTNILTSFINLLDIDSFCISACVSWTTRVNTASLESQALIMQGCLGSKPLEQLRLTAIKKLLRSEGWTNDLGYGHTAMFTQEPVTLNLSMHPKWVNFRNFFRNETCNRQKQ